MEQDDWVGTTVYDEAGEEVGRVEHVYPDQSGAVRYVKLKIGTLFAKHRLVPVDSSERTEDGLRLPYSKETIERAPDLPDDIDPLSGMVAEDLRGYYAGDSAAQVTPAPGEDDPDAQAAEPAARPIEAESGPAPAEAVTPAATDRPAEGATAEAQQIGEVRDRGDVIEIPVTEERLVKQPVVTEVIRVRKTAIPEKETVSAELRKEDVEVESQGDVPVRENHGEAERSSQP